jgi:hypothetical protein
MGERILKTKTVRVTGTTWGSGSDDAEGSGDVCA